MQEAPHTEAIVEMQVALGLLHSAPNSPYYKELNDLLNKITPQPLGTGNEGKVGESFYKDLGTVVGAINLANAIQPVIEGVERLLGPQNATPLSPADRLNLEAIHNALARAASALRASAVPRVSKAPGSVVWSSCTDRSARGEPSFANPRIQHRDRHEVLSLVLNYREYWNSTSDWGNAPNDTYAGGKIIHLRIIEPKLSFPISGRLDILDAQAGIGAYFFASDGLPGTRVGMIVEPIRFDLHFPSRWADTDRNFWARLPLALSVRAGVVLFPAGFEPNAFSATGAAARHIPGGDALFEWGIVVNVGRLIQTKKPTA
jgi:hypothetical protein